MQRARLTQQQLKQEFLLIQAAQHTPARFGVLYERYYEQIFLFIFKRVGKESVSGDITSQVFLKAMLNLKKYTFKGVPFSSWLYRIASNEVNQFYRQQKSQRLICVEKEDLEQMLKETNLEVENSSIEEERNIKALLETLEEIRPEDAQLIELRFFEKRPFKEIAYILGITENNAKVKVYRIIERIKKRLQKQQLEKK